MSSADFFNVVKRLAVYVLLLLAEMAFLLFLFSILDEVDFLPVLGVLFIFVGVLIGLGYVYSCFVPRGWRLYIAGWFGIYWPLPFTLYISLSDYFCCPLSLNKYFFSNMMLYNFSLPALLVFPTLWFILTEPAPQLPRPWYMRRFIAGVVGVFAVCAGAFYLMAPAFIGQSELARTLSIQVERVEENEQHRIVHLCITNHSDSPVTLGHTVDSLKLHELNRGLSPTLLYKETADPEVRCFCHCVQDVEGSPTPGLLTVPAGGSTKLSLTFAQNAVYPPQPLYLCYPFTYLKWAGTEYRHQYHTLRAGMPRCATGQRD